MRTERGFTVVEIIVAFILLALLLQVFVSTFLFVGKQISTWKKQVIKNNEIQLISKRLSKDLINTKQITTLTDSTYVIYTSNNDSIIYSLVNKSLFRNDHQMNKSVSIDSISIFSSYSLIDSLNIIGGSVDSLNIISTKFDFFCTSNRKETHFSNNIMPRNLTNLSIRNLLYEQESEATNEE